MARVMGLVALISALLVAHPAGAATSRRVAANGEQRHQSGSATCEATGTGSVAIVKGEDSSARAVNGDHNKARVKGDGSTGTVEGDGSTPWRAGGTGTPPPRPATVAV